MNVQDGLRQQDIRPTPKSQVFLTPAQYKTIETFKRALAERPAKPWLFYLHGPDGMGKSWILKQIVQHCDRQQRMSPVVPEATGSNGHYHRAPAQTPGVPVAMLDFSIAPRGVVRPREPFFALMDLRRQLGRFHINLPVFDVAALLYLFRSGQLMPATLRRLFPQAIRPFVYALSDLILDNWKDNAAEDFLDPIERFCRNHSHPVAYQPDMARTTLKKCLTAHDPAQLLQSLAGIFISELRLQSEHAPDERKLVFVFDHLPEGALQYAGKSMEPLGQPVFWIRRFCELLMQVPRSVFLLTGKTADGWPATASDTSWHAETIRFEAISRDRARLFFQHAAVATKEIQKTALTLAGNGHSRLAPLHLVSGYRLAQIMHRRNGQQEPHALTMQADPRMTLARNLIHHLPRDLAFGMIALSAARSFDIDMYLYLGKSLVFNATAPFFNILRQMPFLVELPGSRPSQFQVHPAFRETFKSIGGRLVSRAHQALYTYYSRRADAGEATARAEAVYHLRRAAGERGILAWIEAFDEAIERERFAECHALLAVLPEMGVGSPFWKARISQALARYYARIGSRRSALHSLKSGLQQASAAIRQQPEEPHAYMAKIRLCASLARHDVQMGDPDSASSHIRELLDTCDALLQQEPSHVAAMAFKAEGHFLLAMAESHRSGLESALPHFETAEKHIRDALHRAPRYTEALRIKAGILFARGRMRFQTMQPEQAEQDFRQALNSLDSMRFPTPADLHLKARIHLEGARLQRDRAEFLQAIDQLELAYQAIDTANRQLPENLDIAVTKIRVFIESGWTFWLVAEDQRARECFEAAIKLAEFYLASDPEDYRLMAGLATVLYLQMLRDARPETLQQAQKATPSVHALVFKLLRQRKAGMPTSPRLYALLIDIGDALEWHHDTPQAMKVYKQAAKIADAAAPRHALIAAERLLKIYEHSDDRDAAEEVIGQMVEIEKAETDRDGLHGRIARASYGLEKGWIAYQHSEFEKALGLIDDVQTLLEKAAKGFPQNPFLQSCQADLYHLKGNILARRGHPADAELLFKMATQAYQHARKTVPGLLDIRFQLCLVYLDWARFYLALGNYVGASQNLRSVESILEDLREAGAASDWLHNLTGLMQFEFAQLFHALASYKEAAEYFAAAIATFEAYHQAWPDSIEARHNLAICLMARLLLVRHADDVPKAYDDYHAALTLFKQSLARMPGHRLLERNRLVGMLLFSRLLLNEDTMQAQQLLRQVHNEAEAVGSGARFDVLSLQAQAFILRGKILMFSQKPILATQVFDRARELLDKARECCPDNPQLRMQLADLHMATARAYYLHGDYKLALKYHQKVLDTFATLLEAGYENIDLLFSFAETLAQMGFVHNEHGHEQEALSRLLKSLEAFEHCVVKAPKFVAAYRRIGDIHLMVAHISLKARSSESAGESFKRAISAYEQALKIDAGDLQTLSSMARAHLQYGEFLAASNEYAQALWQFNQAVQEFERILKSEPGRLSEQKRLGDALLNLGDLHMKYAQYHEAKEKFYQAQRAYDAVLDVAPDDLEALYSRAVSRGNLAGAGMQLHEYDQALSMFQKAVQDYQKVRELNEDYGNALFNQGLSFMAMARILQSGHKWEGAQSNLEKAIHAFDDWLKLHPDDLDAVQQKATATAALAEMYVGKELLESAKIYFERAIKILQRLLDDEMLACPAALDISRVTEKLVDVLEKQSEHKKAVARLRAALSMLQKLLPQEDRKVDVLIQLGALHKRLAELYARENIADAVRTHFQKAFQSYYDAFQLTPDDATLRLTLQELKNRMKEFE